MYQSPAKERRLPASEASGSVPDGLPQSVTTDARSGPPVTSPPIADEVILGKALVLDYRAGASPVGTEGFADRGAGVDDPPTLASSGDETRLGEDLQVVADASGTRPQTFGQILGREWMRQLEHDPCAALADEARQRPVVTWLPVRAARECDVPDTPR